MTEYAVEIEVPQVVRDAQGTTASPDATRWALVADWTRDQQEAGVNYGHLLSQGLHVRLVRQGSLTLRHWTDDQRAAVRSGMDAGKSTADRVVVHPADLAEIMDRPDFIIVFKYGSGEPGEVGMLPGIRVFVSPEAPRLADWATKLPSVLAKGPLPRLKLPSVADLQRTLEGLEKLPDMDVLHAAGIASPLPKATSADIERVIVQPIVDEFVKRSQPLPQVPTDGVDIIKVMQPIVDDAIAAAKASPVVRPYVFGGGRGRGQDFETSALTEHIGVVAGQWAGPVDVSEGMGGSRTLVPFNSETAPAYLDAAAKGGIAKENPAPEPPAEQGGHTISLPVEVPVPADYGTTTANVEAASASPKGTIETQPDLKPLPQRQTGDVQTVTAADVQAVLDGTLNPGDPGYIAAYQAAQVRNRHEGSTRTTTRISAGG